MNQLQIMTLPLSVSVTRQFLKDVHSNIVDTGNVIDFLFKQEDINIFEHLKFGLLYSSALAGKSRYEDYRKFIRQYNDTLTKKFEYPLLFIREVYSQLGFRKNMLYVMRQPKFEIDDKTDIFIGNKFKQESDFERILVDSLKNWSDEWTVKRQQFIGHGKCDISVFSNKEKVAIELKKEKALRKDVFQTYEYTKNNSSYVAILIANGFDKETIKLADQLKVNCYEYQLGTLLGDEIPSAMFLESVNEARKKTDIESQIEDINSCDGHTIDFAGIPSTEEASKHFFKVYSQFEGDLIETSELVEKEQKYRTLCPHCNKRL